VRKTTLLDLVVPFAVIGVTAYVLLRFSYGSIPPVSVAAPLPLAVLGVAELIIARRVRAVVRHDPRARPMTAIAVARCVALGKASSLVGAGLGGAAVGLLARVAPDAGSVRAASSDTRAGAFLLAASVVVVIGGMALERAGIDPNRRDRTPRGGG
jgi:hypothetical protein